MSKTVLNVGQCRPDTAALAHFLKSNFGASMISTDLMDDTMQALRDQAIDLVLINRKLDADYSDGMAILKAMKQDEGLSSIPVMLVSNFAEWQEKAVESGAIYGIGKAELATAEATERVREALGL